MAQSNEEEEEKQEISAEVGGGKNDNVDVEDGDKKPAAAPPPPAAAAATTTTAKSDPESSTKSSTPLLIALVLLLIAIIAVILGGVLGNQNIRNNNETELMDRQANGPATSSQPPTPAPLTPPSSPTPSPPTPSPPTPSATEDPAAPPTTPEPQGMPSAEPSPLPTSSPSDNPSQSPSASPSMLPSMSPSTTPTASVDFTVRSSIASVFGDGVNQEGSSFDLAASFILSENPTRSEAEGFADDPLMIQRFALALFYYQTSNNGASPWRSCAPLDDPTETDCLYDNPVDITANSTVLYEQIPSTRWLSDADVCEWAGVFCDFEGLVTSIDLFAQELSGNLPTELVTISSLRNLGLALNEFTGPLPIEYSSLETLEVHSNMLESSIPEGFFEQATDMTLLNIGDNMMTGTLPDEIGAAENLRYFYFFGNIIGGVIPEAIGSIPLIEMRGQNNQLMGPLPMSISQLTMMQQLWLHLNLLTGPIPDGIGSMTSLTYLRLSDNLFSESIPESLYDLSSLFRLYLARNSLTGTISTRVGELSNLERLRLSGNRLAGPIPEELGSLMSLESLELHLNEFSDTVIPQSVCDAQISFVSADCLLGPSFTVETFCTCCTLCCDIVGNCETNENQAAIRETLSDTFGGDIYVIGSSQALATNHFIYLDPTRPNPQDTNFIQRYILTLFYFQMSENGRIRWRSCNPPTGTETANCRFQEFVQRVDDRVTFNQIPSFRWLSEAHECDWAGVFCTVIDQDVLNIELIDHFLQGTVPTELILLPLLDQIVLSFNMISGQIPLEYVKVSTLRSFQLNGNALTGTIPPELFQNGRLASLDVSENFLSGTIPTEIGLLGQLLAFFVQDNALIGSLPTEFGSLTKLQYTRFRSNFLFGPLPTELGLMTDLLELWGFDNQFTGAIPTELGNTSRLRTLRFGQNFLTGMIPPELFLLTFLRRLELEDNSLTGMLDAGISQLTNLNSLVLRNNGLDGPIPAELGDLTALQTLLLGLNMQSGSMPEEICANMNVPGQLTNLQTDCLPLTNPPVQCMCCTNCCDRSISSCEEIMM